MKILLLSVFLFFGLTSMNAQIAVTFTKVDFTGKAYKTPKSTKKVSSKKVHSSLKRTVKVIAEEKKILPKKDLTNKKRNKKKNILDDDIPF